MQSSVLFGSQISLCGRRRVFFCNFSTSPLNRRAAVMWKGPDFLGQAYSIVHGMMNEMS